MRAASLVLPALLLTACAGDRPPPVATTSPPPRPSTGQPAPPTPEPSVADAGPATDAGASAACAEVHLGLDGRAISTNASYDAFVSREAGTLATLAPESHVVRFPGSGAIVAFYEAATRERAMERCEQTVASYLSTAPNMPLVGTGSAAHVVEPCGPCHTRREDAGVP